MDGRFAPSPTGPLHLGSLRTAMLAWLFARSEGSRFLLRVEDLDRVASRSEHEASHLADLKLLGIDWDGVPVRQSERLDLYRDALADLERAGLLYSCYCTRREIAEAVTAPHEDMPEGAYPGTCRGLDRQARRDREAERPPARRVIAEAAPAGATDRLRGWVGGVVDDFVVCRNDGMPAYNLAVVVDDAEQGIEEVVRGDDLLSSVPRQAWLASTLGYAAPAYAHVALVVGDDGHRLAKRHGDVTLRDLHAEGWPAEAVRDRLLDSVGLTPGPLPEVAATFEPTRLPDAPTVLSDIISGRSMKR
ncbi:MAG: tRNA glutamyl-Q(34) synthetase GluQRS [Acidimicrobiales bacterium]